MRKFLFISLILSLIFFTAFIKNSTKRIDDEIFIVKENIRVLKKDKEKIKLEHDYLSSSERLLKFQDLYFEDLLIKKSIDEMNLLNQKSNFFEIKAVFCGIIKFVI